MARSSVQRDWRITSVPRCFCVRTCCEPGRLAVRSFRTLLRSGGSVEMRPHVMSITECPHCHRRVIPSESGECPACNKNVRTEPTTAKGMRLLVVRGREGFPPICFNCGQPATRMVKVQVSNVDALVSIKRELLARLIPFGRLFSAFDAAKRDIFIRLRLPRCDVCRKRKVRPEVQSYDLEAREVRLVVHERFRDGVTAR